MTGQTRLAVTGFPVLHSKSPDLFQLLFQAAGQTASYCRLTARDAREAMKLYRALRLDGMNITTPFKQTIIPLLDDLTPDARAIGAVNTITRLGTRTIGHNTDVAGVANSLNSHGIQVAGKRVTVLGAGGAGRAAVRSLSLGGASITVVNRTREKALKLAEHFGCRAEPIENLNRIMRDTDILISTISSGYTPVAQQWLRTGMVVLDANYRHSPLKELCAKRDLLYIPGETWLIHQALAAYSMFFGQIQGSNLAAHSKEITLPEQLTKRTISLIGFMGCGKSTIGRLLAEKRFCPFIDSDCWIEEDEKSSIYDIFKRRGEVYFREKESLMLQKLTFKTGEILALGGGALQASENRDIVKTRSTVIWLHVGFESCIKRINRSTRPLLEERRSVGELKKLFEQRSHIYMRTADLVVDGDKSAEEIVEQINEEIDLAFNY